MINGKFFAIDDFDVAGHHILNWIWLQDIPVGNSTEGQAIVHVGGVATWATLTASGIVSVDWDDITGKPAKFPPEDHTHPWDEITSKPTFVNSVTAGTNITVSDTTGTGISIATVTSPSFSSAVIADALIHDGDVDTQIKFEIDGFEFETGGTTVIFVNTSAITIDNALDVTGEIYCQSVLSATQLQISGTVLRPVHLDGTGYSTGETPTWNATATEFQPAAGGGGSGTTLLEAFKASDETRTNSAVFADDTDLQFAVLANGVYYIYGIIFYSAHTTPDFKLQFVTTTGNGTLRMTETHLFNSNPYGLASARVSPGPGVDTQKMYCFHGVLTVAGANDTFKLQWAQNVSNASATKIHGGSLMIGQKLA